ncbi:D-alanyl-D-alanine carboxypeptidase family protein [Hyphomicrobium sp.]|jgi:D-alanyl-D-alanine carboxypeptidase|uniref:D-alanyl-D-alanine carboxypeptidase family protein n=1 Tax=Hyphomicrobium sp. TaxID=82 RepID=UPI002CA0CF9E|nr:D-alanyl-D-alanine carboxypeptidase family protein [Hyphomicrobium sp.]HVZ05833.1 D-alanyl-D-alanine carboxypeptidase family protein [Hyphomicrobium sp.]
MRARAAQIAAIALFWIGGIASASANPALLFEPSTGKVLYAEDIDDVWYPASLTKLTTAYLAFEAIKSGKLRLDEKIPCSLVATLQPPSKAGIKVGQTLTVEKALQAVIVKSANDVTVMLAEAIAGSESAFVEQMNATAQRLGMTRTHFDNTNGLPSPGQLTTARDLAKIATAVIRDFPQYASYWSMPAMYIGKRRLGNHNALLRTFPGADGMKTGFICDSGYNVAATATRDGRRLMAIVLGESSGNERAIRAAALLEYGFQDYAWKDYFTMPTIDTVPVDPNAKGITSVRDTVVAWSCNDHHRHRVVHKVHKARKAKRAASKGKAVKKGTAKAQQSVPAKNAAAASASP